MATFMKLLAVCFAVLVVLSGVVVVDSSPTAIGTFGSREITTSEHGNVGNGRVARPTAAVGSDTAGLPTTLVDSIEVEVLLNLSISRVSESALSNTTNTTYITDVVNPRSMPSHAKWPPLCGIQGYPKGNLDESYRAAAQLRGFFAQGISCRVDPHACGKVACIGTTEVQLCSEVNIQMWISCATIANMVEDINRRCGEDGYWPRYVSTVVGQEFDDRGFNVVVREKYDAKYYNC